MKKLDHKHLIKIYKAKNSAVYTEEDGTTSDVKYMALELARHGNLFDIIVDSGKFSDNLARYYFHQLVEAIEHMHSKGIAHRDLKLENILIDENFDLKLTDFGFSDEEKVSDRTCGTNIYMAPEMHVQDEFETIPADIFTLGV